MAKNKKTTHPKIERLDPLSKIIIATFAINYMANLMFTVNKEMKIILPKIEDKNKFIENGITDRDTTLNEVVKKLGEIMDQLGNCINNDDAACEIDERVVKEAFEIIVHGNDFVH